SNNVYVSLADTPNLRSRCIRCRDGSHKTYGGTRGADLPALPTNSGNIAESVSCASASARPQPACVREFIAPLPFRRYLPPAMKRALFALLSFAIAVTAFAAWHVSRHIAIGGTGGWDYVS